MEERRRRGEKANDRLEQWDREMQKEERWERISGRDIMNAIVS